MCLFADFPRPMRSDDKKKYVSNKKKDYPRPMRSDDSGRPKELGIRVLGIGQMVWDLGYRE